MQKSEPYDNYNQVISQLQDYMLTNKKLDDILGANQPEKIAKIEKKQDTKPIQNTIKDSLFYPKEKDSLFWCFYIIKNGLAKYGFPGITDFVNEKKEKFECIEFLRKCKQQLKTKKIKNIREDVEHDLANNPGICMKTFIALCIGNNINIMFIENRKCFELIFDDSSPIYVVHCFKIFSSLKYALELDASPEKIEEYRNTLFKWESVEKPLKAVSAYKSGELMDICKRFGFYDQHLKEKTKKDLYELILTKL
jgi:hypothetical protein